MVTNLRLLMVIVYAAKEQLEYSKLAISKQARESNHYVSELF